MSATTLNQPFDESDPKLPSFHREILRVANAIGFFPTKAQAKAIAHNFCRILEKDCIVAIQDDGSGRIPTEADGVRVILESTIRRGMAMGPALVKDQAKHRLLIHHLMNFEDSSEDSRLNALQVFQHIQQRVSRARRFDDEADFLRILSQCVNDDEVQIFEGGILNRADFITIGLSDSMQSLRRSNP